MIWSIKIPIYYSRLELSGHDIISKTKFCFGVSTYNTDLQQ